MSEEAHFDEARTWYHECYESVRASRRRDRKLITGLVLLALVQAVVQAVTLVVVRLPDPIIVVKDSETGHVQVASPLSALRLERDEALVESQVLEYVQARESYDPRDLQVNYERVYVQSSREIWKPYEELYERGRPGNLLDLYQQNTQVEVRIKQISLPEPGRAQVRFSTVTRRGNQTRTEHWAAALQFRYVERARDLTERSRNPLGFQVVHYRRDQEVVHADVAP
jgi:type IV secretion system protein VirB8